ncbi:hypothetical protein DICPUDRAFT_157845 [Dictyostelium purpureum]|uniref:Carrier domain-containing protein n=1 Tax=Dictyostelium purpureum TaxID=5786 RepID=F1A052_DICPU|nr:uncharacterized protein DICPUDRAFT_157845 [Dictyostelium purpureum]EGC30425.1 hypothetical protein DICPUDRAFT_157845 [Dictyostelium purpureum]|eukprot:XP_003293049.1 hypothetical protein DICPUDRAFT_157845 [Dictyostelium purpureum]
MFGEFKKLLGFKKNTISVVDNPEKKENDTSYNLKGNEINNKSSVHYGCNGCTGEIIGDVNERYCCTECSDFDICKDCYNKEIIINYAIYESDKLSTYTEEEIKEKERKKQEALVNYEPVKHHDDAPPHLHRLTLEMKTQFQLVYELRGKTLFETMRNSFQQFSDRSCLGYRDKVQVSEKYPLGLSDYKWKTYKQVYESSLQVANSISHYLEPNDFISIYMDNCLEWYVSDFASLWCNLVVVPIHHQSNNLNLLEILSNSDTKCISLSKDSFKNFIELFEQVDEKTLKEKPLSVKLIIHKEDEFDKELVAKLPEGIVFKTWNEVIQFGKENPSKWELKPPTDIENQLASVTYTSGSTGLPKGVMKTDKTWNLLVCDSFIYYPNVILSYNTLSHSQRLSDWRYLYQGSRVGIYSGSMDTLFDDISQIRPHSFWAVPRFWNLLYSQYKNDLKEYTKLNPNEPLPLAKLHCQKQIKALLGNRIKTLVTGGAPTSKEVLTFLNSVWKDINISNSYGLTEISGVCVDGFISDDIEFRIDPVPSFNYYPTDKPHPRGELVVKGPYMSSGYYKNQDLTSQSFSGGWFKTGDIVELVGSRKVNIIDRIKHAFKLANGEFVTPEPLENQFQGSVLIDQMFIHGNSLKTFLVAVVKPSIFCLKQLNLIDKELDDQQAEQEIITNIDQLISSTVLKSKIYEEINKISQEKKLANYEIPKIISLDFTKWTIDNELITGSGKFSRANLYKHYKETIEKMFDTIDVIQDSLRNNNSSNIENTGSDPTLIADYLKSVLNITDGDADLSQLSFTQIGGDSLGAVKLSTILREKEGLDISPQLILNQNFNLSNLTKIIGQKQDNNESSSSRGENDIINKFKVNWDDEMKLDSDIINKISMLKSKNGSLEYIKSNSNVLLTGVTGFLGIFSLYELINCNNIKNIYCIMRNIKFREDGIQKLIGILENSSIQVKNIREKVIPVSGDLSMENFGVSDTDYELLSKTVDIVIHNGAVVNMALPYANMKATNVQSTRDIIRFCLSNTTTAKPQNEKDINNTNTNKNNSRNGLVKRLVYISTVGVLFGTTNNGNLIDESITPSTEYLDQGTGYNQSKLIADILVREAASLGLPAMIFRPGTIFAHSMTGFENQIDFIGLTIKGILGSKTYPINYDGGNLNLSPVDWVSSSIISLVNNEITWASFNNAAEIYHMVNKNILPLEKLCKYLNENIKIEKKQFDEWKSIQFSSPSNPLYPISNLFSNSNRFPSGNKIINTKTIKVLESINKSQCPEITSKMVKNYVNYLNLKKMIKEFK